MMQHKVCHPFSSSTSSRHSLSFSPAPLATQWSISPLVFVFGVSVTQVLIEYDHESIVPSGGFGGTESDAGQYYADCRKTVRVRSNFWGEASTIVLLIYELSGG